MAEEMEANTSLKSASKEDEHSASGRECRSRIDARGGMAFVVENPFRQMNLDGIGDTLPSYALPTVASRIRMSISTDKLAADELPVCHRYRPPSPLCHSMKDQRSRSVDNGLRKCQAEIQKVSERLSMPKRKESGSSRGKSNSSTPASVQTPPQLSSPLKSSCKPSSLSSSFTEENVKSVRSRETHSHRLGNYATSPGRLNKDLSKEEIASTLQSGVGRGSNKQGNVTTSSKELSKQGSVTTPSKESAKQGNVIISKDSSKQGNITTSSKESSKDENAPTPKESSKEKSVTTPSKEPSKQGNVTTPSKESSKQGSVVSSPKESSKQGSVSSPKESSKQGSVVSSPKESSKQGSVISSPKEPSKQGSVISSPKESSKDGSVTTVLKDVSKEGNAATSPKDLSKQGSVVTSKESAKQGSATTPSKESVKDLDVKPSQRKHLTTSKSPVPMATKEAKPPRPEKNGKMAKSKEKTPTESETSSSDVLSGKAPSSKNAAAAENVEESPSETVKDTTSQKVTSEVGKDEQNKAKVDPAVDEYRAKLAEKRRLAREKAEREVEEEKRRQEEMRLAEVERRRKEEEEQRRREEEELRLAEELRKAEEERFQKMVEMEEKRRRDEAEQVEADLQAKLEQQRRAKEEAEKQDIERQVRIKREEQEKMDRKRRLESIMKRVKTEDTPSTAKSEPLATQPPEPETKSNGTVAASDASLPKAESTPSLLTLLNSSAEGAGSEVEKAAPDSGMPKFKSPLLQQILAGKTKTKVPVSEPPTEGAVNQPSGDVRGHPDGTSNPDEVPDEAGSLNSTCA